MIIYLSRRWGYVGARAEESKKKHLVLVYCYCKKWVLRTFQNSESMYQYFNIFDSTYIKGFG